MRRKLQILLGLAVSLLFLYFTLRGTNWSSVWSSLKQAAYWFLIPAILTHFLAFYVRSYKWSIILKHFKKVTTNELFPITSIGLAMNNILPLRAGEIGRIVILANKFGITKVTAGISILLERLFDIIGLFLLLLLVISFRKWPDYITHYISFAIVITLIAVIVLPIGLFIASKFSSHELITKFHLSWIMGKIQEAKDAYFIFQRPKMILILSLISLLLWIIESIGYYFIALAFHLPVSFLDFFFICVIINLASAIPSSSAYIGTFEFVGTSLLVFLGVAKALALSYILILHLELVLPVTLLGLYLYFTKRYYTFISLRTIEHIEYGQ